MTVRGRDELFALAAATLEMSGAESETTLRDVDSALTRFANNTIHQNVAERGLSWRLRLIDRGRVGVAEMSGESDGVARRLVDAARQAQSVLPETEVSPLPAPSGDPDTPVAFSQRTAEADPEQRAALAEVIIAAGERAGLQTYGCVSTQVLSTAICNTTGVRRHATSSDCGAVVVMRGQNGSGYAARYGSDISQLDAAGLAAEAVETCRRNQDPVPIDPGEYEVVLSPYAVAEMLAHLSWVGLSALSLQEHRSFMRMGERLMSETVTIVDDPRCEELFPYPFDAEGVTAQTVPLIDHGACAGVVYDTPTALRDGVRSTGHSLPQPNTWGPMTTHLVMDGGDADVGDLIGSVKRGLYVNRFWYVRDVHPLRTIITGMTREGTFLIEHGELGSAVRDLRFTQSMVEALGDVRGVSSARRLEMGEFESGILAPWLHLGHFSFSS